VRRRSGGGWNGEAVVDQIRNCGCRCGEGAGLPIRGELAGCSRTRRSLVNDGLAREVLGSPVQQGRVRPGYDEVRVS